MTLREINNLLREKEVASDCALPLERLTAALTLLRSINQGEICTLEGLHTSINTFIEEYGPVTTESVDEFMRLPDTLLDYNLNNQFILDALEAD